MYKLIFVIVSVIVACVYAKPGIVGYSQPFVAPYVAAASSQVVARRYNGFAGTVVAAPAAITAYPQPYAAPFAYAAPYTAPVTSTAYSAPFAPAIQTASVAPIYANPYTVPIGSPLKYSVTAGVPLRLRHTATIPVTL